MNEDRYYDKGQYDEEPEVLATCECGEEIVEGYPHIVVDGEYFCDQTCFHYQYVLNNYEVTENEGQFGDNKDVGTCKCGQTINSDYEFYIIDDEFYCDSNCIFEHYVKQGSVVEEN